VIAEVDGKMLGYCFGDAGSGGIVVLALLPPFEGRGVGKALLISCVNVVINVYFS